MIRPLRRTLTLAASLVAVLSVSEGVSAAEGTAAEALAPGSWSVQFSVQPNFTLGSFSGSTLSLKRHLASGNALRFGLSLNVDDTSIDLAEMTVDTFATRTQSGADEGNLWSIGVGAYYLWYTGRAAPVHAYWGAGPTVSWSRRHNERTQTLTQTPTGQPAATYTFIEDLTDRGWTLGIAGTAGVEWLVARRVGLFAEYGSSLSYTSREADRSWTGTTTGSGTTVIHSTQDVHGWDFSGSGGRLGVSAYY
jgi:hypothetical protein